MSDQNSKTTISIISEHDITPDFISIHLGPFLQDLQELQGIADEMYDRELQSFKISAIEYSPVDIVKAKYFVQESEKGGGRRIVPGLLAGLKGERRYNVYPGEDWRTPLDEQLGEEWVLLGGSKIGRVWVRVSNPTKLSSKISKTSPRKDV